MNHRRRPELAYRRENTHPSLMTVPDMSRVSELKAPDREEVLEFLSKRPVHTVIMTSCINDNGFDSEFNRGAFYGYKNAQGALEGVALVGHTTLVEVRTDEALKALAVKARESEIPIHFMMSDGDSIESFWRYYSPDNQEPRLVCSELLFEIKHPVLVREIIPGLRPATREELIPIAEAHADVAFQESQVDPLEKDCDGFLKRLRRRIEQGRVWVVFDKNTLLFKADVVAETSEVMYLEGIYVNPERRGQGIGANCLSQLSRTLLEKVKYVCLLSNSQFHQAHRAYLKAGFKSKDYCVTMFV